MADKFDSKLVNLKVKNNPNQINTIPTQLENIVKENKIKMVAKKNQNQLNLRSFNIYL